MKRSLLYLALLFMFSTTFAQVQVSTVPKEEIADVPFAVIEDSPVYPGCAANTNRELKKCTSENIEKFVNLEFNQDLIKQLQLNFKRMRISVQFKINKEGKVVDIRARAPHPDLEKEAIRAVSALPQMKPGQQRKQKVGTLYALPIIFEFNAPKKSKRKKRTRKS